MGPFELRLLNQIPNKMDFKVISSEQFQELINKISELQKIFTQRAKVSLAETWLTNDEVANILKVTTRTLQNYRDRSMLPYSHFGGKIYYRASDIQKHLEDHYIKPRNWESQGKLNLNN